MNKENLNLFQQIVQAHNITCTIVEKDFSNLYKTDLELRYKLYSDYDYSDFPDDMEGILEARDRQAAGPLAPAEGLTLEEVYYQKI